MGTNVFIALINPAMALIFASTFALLWHHQRQRRYIAILALSFLALSGGFLFQYFAPLGIVASKLVSNLLFLAAAVGLANGALGRYGRAMPIRAVVLFGGGGIAAFLWFMLVVPDLSWRIYAINFAFGAIALVLAAELRAVDDRKMIDNLLLGIVLFWGVSLFPRPIIIMWLDGPYRTYEDFHNSLYWITLVFSASLFLLLFALSMITAVALDVMDELLRKSQTDSLSGLLNRRGFEEGIAAAFSMPQRSFPAALIICDIDRFKSVNDRFGHACGDKVIEHFSECLREAAEGQHVVGRIGGEEFAILLEHADAATARLLAEGIRIAFSHAAVPGVPKGERFTASFGVAEAASGETVEYLFRRADKALYEAKHAGRDRVCVSPAPHKDRLVAA